jgi:hypothetical protein
MANITALRLGDHLILGSCIPGVSPISQPDPQNSFGRVERINEHFLADMGLQ